jgi:hypothetical protein
MLTHVLLIIMLHCIPVTRGMRIRNVENEEVMLITSRHFHHFPSFITSRSLLTLLNAFGHVLSHPITSHPFSSLPIPSHQSSYPSSIRVSHLSILSELSHSSVTPHTSLISPQSTTHSLIYLSSSINRRPAVIVTRQSNTSLSNPSIIITQQA